MKKRLKTRVGNGLAVSLRIRTKKSPRFVIVAVLLASVGLLLVFRQNHQANAAGGLTVSPALVNITVGQPAASQPKVVIRNDFTVPANIEVSLQGVTQKDGQLVPGGQVEPALNGALTVTPTSMTIEAGKTANVNLEVHDSKNISPGGHYAFLLIKQTSTQVSKLTLQPAISVTMFIIKQNGAVSKMSLTKVTAIHNIFSLPKTVDVSFYNEGNIHIVPRAAIIISTNNGTKRYGDGIVNDRSIPLFPKNQLKLRSTIHLTGHPWYPRKYNIAVQYRYDGASSSSKYSISFWYIPPYFLLFVIIALVPFVIKRQQAARASRRRQLEHKMVRPRRG